MSFAILVVKILSVLGLTRVLMPYFCVSWYSYILENFLERKISIEKLHS